VEQVEAERQEGSAVPVGEEAEVADAYEAAREQVEVWQGSAGNCRPYADQPGFSSSMRF
jgi:hypothetical protein